MSAAAGTTKYAHRIVLKVSDLLARDARGELDETQVEWSSVVDVYLWALKVLEAERAEP